MELVILGLGLDLDLDLHGIDDICQLVDKFYRQDFE